LRPSCQRSAYVAGEQEWDGLVGRRVMQALYSDLRAVASIVITGRCRLARTATERRTASC
jgi:hypothetical protein